MYNWLHNIRHNFKSVNKFIAVAVLIGSFFLSLAPSTALAANDTVISGVMCNIVVMLTGKVGKAVATIAIVVLGIGLFLGKLSWSIAVATSIGIGLIFGANQVVTWLTPDNAPTSQSCTN